MLVKDLHPEDIALLEVHADSDTRKTGSYLYLHFYFFILFGAKATLKLINRTRGADLSPTEKTTQ